MVTKKTAVKAAIKKTTGAKQSNKPAVAADKKAVPQAKEIKPVVKKPAQPAANKVAVKAVKAVKPAVVKPADKVGPSHKPVATKPAKKAVVKAVKDKLVRDSFTMPKDDHRLLKSLKRRGVAFGLNAKKSEIVRAGLKALATLTDEGLKAVLGSIPQLKLGRPRKD